MYIRIINTPSGEAPEQGRAAWVGIVLPLAILGIRDVATIGVLSLPKTWLGSLYAYLSGGMKRAQGYTVKADRAIEILATHSRLGSKLVAGECSGGDPTWNVFLVSY